MKWFYNWCARVAANYQKKLTKEIEEHTFDLQYARHSANICYQANQIANQHGNTGFEMTPERIAVLVAFANMRARGFEVHWEQIAKEREAWFVEHGIAIPEGK
jgi:hypothetical protein